ncbi:hypothetical protein OG389_06070 [Streptomyces sp. NBC_00435]|uniref:hypothetical protein n=1 Tax=Streptomyces sp. NBC_00435 TaxID=2903649 RepID=UPI002E219DF9
MVIDRERQLRGEVVKLYPSPEVLRLMDAGGFQWIARTRACRNLRKRDPRTKPDDRIRIPPGTAPMDCPPNELRVGDHVLAGGNLIPIADLRYRAGATRTMILRNGAVCVAERPIRVYRRFA